MEAAETLLEIEHNKVDIENRNELLVEKNTCITALVRTIPVSQE